MDETPIEVVAHDPAWADRFVVERDRLATLVGDHTARIEHVGSTAVPGLPAKPIVDVTAVVADLAGLWGDLDALSTVLGYAVSHVPGDWLLLQRTGDDGQGYNLHLVPAENDRWRDDLLFREYLRSNPAARGEYAAVKREAAEAHPHDIGAYNAAKAECCRTILERAKADPDVTVSELEGENDAASFTTR